MTEHKGLPVEGYQPQSDAKVSAVNVNKRLEEEILRRIDTLPRHLACDRVAGAQSRLLGAPRRHQRAGESVPLVGREGRVAASPQPPPDHEIPSVRRVRIVAFHSNLAPRIAIYRT